MKLLVTRGSQSRFLRPLTILFAVLVVAPIAATISAADHEGTSLVGLAKLDPNALAIGLDRGAPGLTRALAALRTRASMLVINAHPDDEDGGMLAEQTRGLGARVALMSLTRGEGGQNAMSTDFNDALGILRTQELLQSDRFYGVDQYWGTVIDYGFSKTREEALEKWGYNRVLYDTVRVVRMTRPLVITSTFVGAPTDGHGNHQVAGQMAQEVYTAAGDPKVFPEQIKDGLRPWKPLKVYARTPFFAPTKENTIYDYATDKYVPIRFYDYVNKAWIDHQPSTDLKVPEGSIEPASGLTFQQIGREGWGYQKSQNGGATLPQPVVYSSPYHRYGSRVPNSQTETSFYDGIDISLRGIASLSTGGDTKALSADLTEIARCVDETIEHYKPGDPSAVAPSLAEELKLARKLSADVRASALSEPGRSDILFELQQKEKQFESALTLALNIWLDASVAAEKKPSGPFAAFAGPQPVFTIAIPGQSFHVEAKLFNGSSQGIKLSAFDIAPSDGKKWAISSGDRLPDALAGGTDFNRRFAVSAPPDALPVKPYFYRPNSEQPYYDLLDARFRNLSTAPYPLSVSARVSFNGVEWEMRKLVQTYQHQEGVGNVAQPMLVEPPISVSISPGAGAVPLSSKSFDFTCTLQSNVKGDAKGTLHIKLPEGWTSDLRDYPFVFTHDGETDSIRFQITPHNVRLQSYEISAAAEYGGHTFSEGYRLVGYPGVRSYPYYRPATYRAVGVDVITPPGLHVGFFPGTGDEVPRSLRDLGVPVQVLAGADLVSGDLKAFDAIILGVRAYSGRPELRGDNKRLLDYVQGGGTLVVQYNTQVLDEGFGPYPFSLGSNPQKVVDENSAVKFIEPSNPLLSWPNKITEADFHGWEEERGHGFMKTWDPHYTALFETHDPDQDPQRGGLLVARYGRGFYVYDAFALYRQLTSGVPGAYRILANLISLSRNPNWK